MRNPSQKESLLASFLDGVRDFYDLVIIDCPPTESVLTTAAYVASDFVLVPVKPEFLSSIGLPLLDRSLKEFFKVFRRRPEVAGIVFTFTTNYSPEEIKAKREVAGIAQAFGWHVFENEVRFSRSIAKSAREARPVFWTSYTRSTVIDQFRRVSQEFARQIGGI